MPKTSGLTSDLGSKPMPHISDTAKLNSNEDSEMHSFEVEVAHHATNKNMSIANNIQSLDPKVRDIETFV